MARPSSPTSERRDQIERALAKGAPLNVAAASAGVSPRSVSRWLEQGRIARRYLSAVPEPGAAESAPADPGLPADDEAIQRALVGAVLRASQNDWRAATWLLERRWPQRFSRHHRWHQSFLHSIVLSGQ